MTRRFAPSLLWVLAALSTPSLSTLGADLLQPDARVAIVGDSITEQKLYSKYMEAYLVACTGRDDIRVFQYGWSGETASGFAARLENDLAGFKPTVVTLCYGMNDGQYRPYAEDIGRNYESNMRKVLAGLAKVGVSKVVVGSPGAVDTKYFVRQNFAPLPGADGYNKNLGALRDICRKLAVESGQTFADVHQSMQDAMAKAKAVLGEDYDVCGRDGFHPGPNGHLIMAYAFLRGLGCDGAIGTITVDLQGKVQATPGHRVIESSGGKVALESTRYPFCFEGEAKSSGGTRSIAPFLPFNQDLNRLVLKVVSLNAPKARVTWGSQSKDFSKEQLTAGVNLTAEFDQTPFDDQFRNLVQTVGSKQNFETAMIKNMVTSFRLFGREAKDDGELANAFAAVGQRLAARQERLDAAVRAAIVPINHTLAVAPAP
jgi:lysophospholipase L1-like esterase